MFEVGDAVISGRFGEGIVTDVDNNDLYIYPIHVQWKNSCKRSIFTPEGRYNISFNDPDVDICLLKEKEMKKKNGQIASVIDHNIAKKQDSKAMVEDKKFTETRRRNEEEHKGFKVGDMVYSQFSGVGEIIKIGKNENLEYPIEVKWCYKKDIDTLDYDFFTLDGHFFSDRRNALRDIVPVEEVDMEFEGKDDGTIERMEDALNKKVEDAVNPSHYKVKGLPEAIDIINHLMHREQYEGFLWGNIMKYAYRYGRKGDKAETAGKIAWYANQLKDLAEEGDNK
nr:MAG TPA: nucelotide kinase [Caudoviricetes sp.]